MAVKVEVGSSLVLIDEESLAIIEKFSGNNMNIVSDKNGNRYVAIKKVTDGKVKSSMVARLIVKVPKGKCVIYKNGNTLDLTKENLAVTTRSNAIRCKSKSIDRTSKYIGVSFAKHANKWHSQIKPSKNKKNMHIGYFITEEEAAVAYNDAARKHHGEFAKLNII